jgi:glutamyl-tRNA synthetase
MEKDPAQLAAELMPQLQQAGYTAEPAFLAAVVALMREKVTFAREIIPQGSYFFQDPETFDSQVIAKKWKAGTEVFLTELAADYAALEVFSAEATEETFKTRCATRGETPGQWMQILRVAVSGAAAGPPVFEMLSLLGKETICRRLNHAASHITPITA